MFVTETRSAVVKVDRRSNSKVPQGWEQARLGDIADIAFSSVDKKTVQGEEPVRLCNYTDVYYNRRIVPTSDYMVATATSTEISKWHLKKDDVLFTKDSETSTDIGIPSYVTENMPDVLCGYHLGRARPNPTFVDGGFLTHALASHAVAKEFSRIANGITRFGLTLPGVRSLPLALPPLPAQQAIATVLDSIDETIERTEVVITATEQLREAVREELLTRGLPGSHSEWKDVRRFGVIPAGWRVLPLGSLCGKPSYGANAPSGPYEPSLPRYVRVSDITDEGLLRADGLRSADPKKVAGYELHSGDLLFARSGSVGRTYLYQPRDGQCVYAGYLIRFRPVPGKIQPEYLRHYTQSHHYRRWVGSVARRGAQTNINATEYSSLPTLLPPLREQRSIAGALDSIDNAIEMSRRKREALTKVKVSIAEALLTGQRRVPVEVGR